jgi:hypothetical protein
MKDSLKIQLPCYKLLPLAFCLIFCFNSLAAFSQISSVNTLQNLNFGAFSQGSSGGTLNLSPSGVRSATGTVVPLNLGVYYSQAIFEIEATEGTIISITKGSDATLLGSNGGSMTLHIGNSIPASPFITAVSPPGKTQVHIGGTLTIGSPAQNPPGTYSGTFFITFHNE